MSIGGSYNSSDKSGSNWGSSVAGGNFATNNNYNPNVTAYTDDLLGKARNVGNTPYTPFSGGVTGNMQEQQLGNSIGANAVQNVAGYYQPNITNVDTHAGQLANTNLSAYMNPFENTVVDQNAQDIDRTRQMQQQGNASSAVANNAYGGSAGALLASETNRGAANAAAQSSANLRYAGYTNAQDRATADIDRTFASDTGNANRNVGVQQSNQQSSLAAAGLRANAGANLLSQSNTNQAQNYQEFLRQQQQPYMNLGAMRDAVTGLPLNTSIFGNTQNAVNNFGGNQGSSSGWGVQGSAGLA